MSVFLYVFPITLNMSLVLIIIQLSNHIWKANKLWDVPVTCGHQLMKQSVLSSFFLLTPNLLFLSPFFGKGKTHPHDYCMCLRAIYIKTNIEKQFFHIWHEAGWLSCRWIRVLNFPHRVFPLIHIWVYSWYISIHVAYFSADKKRNS